LVTTADATQGHKADVTVVVATISEFQKKSGEGKEPFWCDPDRLNVSLSRARYELVLTGNLHILEQKKGWEEFLAEAKQKTIVVGQDYLDVIRMEGAQHNHEGELATGKLVRCTPYYTEEGRRYVSWEGTLIITLIFIETKNSLNLVWPIERKRKKMNKWRKEALETKEKSIWKM